MQQPDPIKYSLNFSERMRERKRLFGKKAAKSFIVKFLSVKLTPFRGDHDFSISRNYFFNLSSQVFCPERRWNRIKNVNKIEIKI